MSKVLVTKSKLDTLASVIGGKSGETVPMTIDEMTSAVEGIQTGGGPANLQTKSETYTPSTSSQSDVIVADAGYDGLDEVDITIDAVALGQINDVWGNEYFRTFNNQRKFHIEGGPTITEGWFSSGDMPGVNVDYTAIPSGTTITPTESAQTIGGANYMMEGAVTVSAIPSNYVGSGITRRSSSDITVNGNSITAPAGYYSSSASKSVASGTAGTPTATKGTVSNHSISVTPSVTNTTGYITGSTKTGTAVTVTASELVSGDKSITQNGTNIDVTNYETVSVAVPSPFELTYSYDSVNDVFTFDKTYAEIKAAIQDDEQIIYISSSEQVLGDIYDDGYYTNKTVSGTTFSECVALLLQANIDSRDRVVVLYYGLVSGVLTQKWVKSYVKPYDAKSISSNGNYIDVNDYSAVHVSVPNSYSAGDEGKVVSSGALVSQTSDTVTANDTYDTTLINSLTVNVSGGSSSPTVATSTTTLSAAASSIQFTGLSGNPTSFAVTAAANISTGGTTVAGVVYDGTNVIGQTITSQVTYDSSSFSKSYSSGTLTITSSSASFQADEYKLIYTYSGSSSDIHTSDVQVGSGATSITFSGLSGEPMYYSCIFKSDFATSSGYQRVIEVANDGTNTYGLAMDSGAKAQTSWTASYSGGSLTITSSGTNNGGYFHQPGYYQLTYAVDPNAPNLQAKTGIGASTSSQTITADNGYDGLASVQINPVSQTNLTAANIKSGTTISISNGSTNLWSVTGTYSGGGSSMNVQTHQSTSRTTSTSLSSVNSLTCSTTGTYDVYWTCTRSSTSGTWSSRLYIAGTASGDEQTTWTNHVQTVHLTNVSITANQTVAVYAKSRGSNYYAYAPQLTIVQTS